MYFLRQKESKRWVKCVDLHLINWKIYNHRRNARRKANSFEFYFGKYSEWGPKSKVPWFLSKFPKFPDFSLMSSIPWDFPDFPEQWPPWKLHPWRKVVGRTLWWWNSLIFSYFQMGLALHDVPKQSPSLLLFLQILSKWWLINMYS